MSHHNHNRNNRNNGFEEVHFGTMKWYSRPRNSTSEFGYVRSGIDGSETRVDARVLVNCASLDEGSLILYRKGRRVARSVFDLSRPAEGNQYNQYWEMLVKLASYKGDPDYARFVRIARKYFASAEDRVSFLLCILREVNPFERLPETILIHYPEFFGMATDRQRRFLYENRITLFSRCWEDWKTSNPDQAKQAVPGFPADFLLRFPDCFDAASKQQRLYLLQTAASGDISRERERELTYLAAKARGVKYLVHFTRTENLKGILRDGRLITRDKLESRDDSDVRFTDENRLDYVTDSISLSASFPNCPMFYVKRKSDQYRLPVSTGWCVLLLKVELLRDFDCLFNQENAASNNCRYLSREERMSFGAFNDMFAEGGQRGKLITIDENWCDIYATHPQAEILCLGDIPISYIERCCFASVSPDDPWSLRCRDIKKELDPLLEECGIESVFDNKYFGYGPYRLYSNAA